jgi:hypothetical protein
MRAENLNRPNGIHCPVEPPNFYVRITLSIICQEFVAVLARSRATIVQLSSSADNQRKTMRTRYGSHRIAQTKGSAATTDRMSCSCLGSIAGRWPQNHW